MVTQEIEFNLGDPNSEIIARIAFLKAAYGDAPAEYQPVIPRGTPQEIPFTPNQMIVWEHLQSGVLPVEPQVDVEAFIRLGCRWSCTNCSVPEHIRHAPEVLMKPQFWDRVFEIIEARVVQRENPDFTGDDEPYIAPYARIIGGEPSTYHPWAHVDGKAASFGDVVDIMRIAKARPFFMAGLFSDGAALGQQPDIMERLVDVLERYHTSVDYMPKEKLPDLKSKDTTDRDNRASYGAYVASYFAAHGIDAVANIVLIPPDSNSGEPGNLDHILEISQYLWSRGISTTYVPIIWRSHQAQHGRKKEAYSTQLRSTHTDRLREVVDHLVEAQLGGIGMIRNSRAYIEGLPYAGVDQLVSWHSIPKTISISPNGRMGYDPMYKTLDEVLHSPGSYYGYEDHQDKWTNFRGIQYISMLERELKKWQWIVAARAVPATRIVPADQVENIRSAISFWENNSRFLEPSHNGKGVWWDNTIKNTKVGKYRGRFRQDIPREGGIGQDARP